MYGSIHELVRFTPLTKALMLRQGKTSQTISLGSLLMAELANLDRALAYAFSDLGM